MARKPRIEYEGAVYHVMNRGDRGGRIFKDGLDYDLFLAAASEVCKRCGWRIHSYVLMPNHFHWLLETLEANLVAGMKWFLGAYSQRFNVRHGQRGHVFQGRYKALPIDTKSGGYFETVSTYVHLNPVRAGLLKDEQRGLEQYRWSSYPQYLSAGGGRPEWLVAERVLGNLGLGDNRKGRREYAKYMAGRMFELRTRHGRQEFKEEWKLIRHGWYLGGEEFKEKLLKKLSGAVSGKLRESYEGEAIRQHDEYEAERIVRVGMKVLDLKEADLARLPKGDMSKCLLAWLVHSGTIARHRWISERLQMGRPSNLSERIKRVRTSKDQRMHRQIKQLEVAL